MALLLLVIPLLIHTLFIYREEILNEEQDTRDTLMGIGTQMALRISNQIENDWKILEMQVVPPFFHSELISAPAGVQGNFANVNKTGTRLFVGKVIQSGTARGFAHPTEELLKIPSPPFPIHASLVSPPPKDHVIKQIPVPLTDLVLTVSTDWNLITDLQTSRWIFRIALFLGLVIVVGGGLLSLFAKKFSRSLETLRGTMERVAEGAVHSRFAPQRFGFEINAIGLEMNRTLDELLRQEEIARKEGAERERLAEELALGRKIQNDLLPSHIPIVQGLHVSSGYLAAKEVSGDFYDLYLCKAALHQHVLIVMADLAGKGIEACLHALGLRSSLRAFASSSSDLKEIALQAQDLFLLDAADRGLFATLWIGLLVGNKLSFLSLGHPPTLLKRKGEIRELTTGNPALGILDPADLQVQTIVLEPKDELLLYTDGAIEAMNENQQLFGHARLKEAFARSHSSQEILESIEHFAAGASQHDDLTLLFMTVEKSL